MERAELTSPNADGSPGSASPAASMSGAGTSMTPEGGLDAWLPCLDASGQTVRRTLLMQACQSGSLQLVRMLLDAGVSVAAAAPEDGHTALHAAAACADATAALEAIKLLLSVPGGQALLALKDASGNTPLDCFLRKGLGALPSDSLAPQHPQQAVPEQAQPSALDGTDRNSGSAAPAAADPGCSADALANCQPTDSAAGHTAAGATPQVAAAVTSQEQEAVDTRSAEFRMYRFKVEDCPLTDALHDHDWTECPYAHPGEKARRRDPRKYNYCSATCPDFRKGSCKRGEACRFAHGVFECWLHPAKYCTQLCKEASACSRSVCFFAHTLAELRTPPEEPPIPAPVSRGMSRNSLQAEDPWASFAAAAAFDHPMANSASLPDASAAWAQLLDCSSAGMDNVASLMEKMNLQSGSPSPSAAPFGLGVAGSTFFTPPVSPGCNSRSLRNTMSPGLTPCYSPVSPHNSSPLKQRPSRLAAAGAQVHRSQNQGFAGHSAADAVQLPQLLAHLTSEQLAMAGLRQGPNHQLLRTAYPPQQGKQQQAQQASLRPPRPVASLSARQLNVHGSACPRMPQAAAHSMLQGQLPLWTGATDAAPVLDLQGFAQLASSLLSEQQQAGGMNAAHGWGMPTLGASALFTDGISAGGTCAAPAVPLDSSFGMLRPESFSLPPTSGWSMDGTDPTAGFAPGQLLLQPQNGAGVPQQ